MLKGARLFLVLWGALALINCGGGGSGGNSDPSPGSTSPPETQLSEQDLTFSQEGPVALTVGESLDNPATAPGSGAITYSSGNEQVAMVDGSGQVTAMGAGSTRITANIAEDSEYSGASAAYDVNVSTRENALSFSSAEVQPLATGKSLSNPASGLASTDITYSSSNTNVATVAPDGVVTAHGLGRSIISAHQEADSVFSAASASFEIRTSAIMHAWSGASDTLLELPEATYGMSLYSSSEPECDIGNFAGCANGSVQAIDGSLVDNNATLGTPAYLKLAGTSEVTAWPHQFSRRTQHQVIEFNGKLWLYGGTSSGRTPFDPWVSSDGRVWQQADSNLPGRRLDHQIVEHGGKLFLIAGNSDGEKSDVWTSTNGTEWTQLTGDAGFPPRADHQAVSFNGKLWVIGGSSWSDSTSIFSDVWSSPDGITWTREVATAPFGGRFGHRVAVYDNRLWLTGGEANGENETVWSSPDGKNWNRAADLEQFANLRNHQMLTHQGKLWIIGTSAYLDFNPIETTAWRSGDGINWEQLDIDAQALADSHIREHQAVSFRDRLWIVGGSYTVSLGENSSGSKRRNWVWSTGSGSSWIRESPAQALPENIYYGDIPVVASDEQFILLDPVDQSNPSDAVIWQSADGLEWSRRTTTGGLLRRSGHRLAYFDNRFWLIGGYDLGSGTAAKNDVWSSPDGISWSQETSDAGFPAETGHRVVVHDNRLWVFAQAEVSGVPTNEVWSSADGINWDLVSSLPQFSPLERYEVSSFNGKLWVSGGSDPVDNTLKRDVWYSGDGKSWQQVIPVPAFPARVYHQVTNYEGKLWLTGGYDSSINALGDIWTSEDGITWIQAAGDAPFAPRYHHQLLPFNGELWMLGGVGHNFEEYRQPWRFTSPDGWRKGYSRGFIAN
ncbi:kelch repeat-containing protein [Microbulbifer sp. JSM ZJ756]|uniref:Kelch repeat-containing protein n=1 Tax=Microbulbifer sp. JSM ZJ756 TaxID=3376191 RepID=UPI0037B48273